jgi:hypothetical protein
MVIPIVKTFFDSHWDSLGEPLTSFRVLSVFPFPTTYSLYFVVMLSPQTTSKQPRLSLTLFCACTLRNVTVWMQTRYVLL